VTVHLEPPSFDAHVRHEHRLIVRYVARTTPVDRPGVIDLTESVSRVVMCRVRKMNAYCPILYWTCRCLDGHTATEFAYASEEHAATVTEVINNTLDLIIGGRGVDQSIMDRMDAEGEACTCPYSYGKRGGNE
jgi:hypothetical protein